MDNPAVVLAVLTISILQFAAAQTSSTSPSNAFINPPAPKPTQDWNSNTVCVLGSRIALEWEMDYDLAWVYLYQYDNGTPSTPFQLQSTQSNIEIEGAEPWTDPWTTQNYSWMVDLHAYNLISWNPGNGSNGVSACSFC